MTPEERKDLARRFLEMEAEQFRRVVRWGEVFRRESERGLFARLRGETSPGPGESTDAAAKAAGDMYAYSGEPFTEAEQHEALWHVREITEYGDQLTAIFVLLESYQLERPPDLMPIWRAYCHNEELRPEAPA